MKAFQRKSVGNVAKGNQASPEPSTLASSSDGIQVIRSQLRASACRRTWTPSHRADVQQHIGEVVLRRSKGMKSTNFEVVTVQDLMLMTELYDEAFFEGKCLDLAKRSGISFRWSRRMTSAGGKTTRTVWSPTTTSKGRTHYEITLSSALLFQTFRDSKRKVNVCGCPCANRLEAMQRILEHELIHLVEMLVWTDSNCAAPRFQTITGQLFGHTEHRHELITQRERAASTFQIRVGTTVHFEFEGKTLRGKVNRVTRRATVLVEHPRGSLFTDGKRYVKYYVPLSLLRLATS